MRHYDAVIVTSRPLETQAVLAHLQEVREETYLTGMVAYAGQFRGKQRTLGVMVAGMGSGKTATLVLLAERLISLYQPTLVCSVGLASGVQEVRPGAHYFMRDRTHGCDFPPVFPFSEKASNTPPRGFVSIFGTGKRRLFMGSRVRFLIKQRFSAPIVCVCNKRENQCV